MSNRNLGILTLTLVALLVAGCVSAPERELSRERPPHAYLPNGRDPFNPDQFSPRYTARFGTAQAGVIRYFERKRGHALNVLELSGGGQNGAFGAGFLRGWRESGRRPQFDMVTGVSTGGLLATHALLGTPADDAVLEEIFTGVTKDDIYKERGIVEMLSGANALYDTAPLRALIEKYITPEVLQRVAAAGADHRVLIVGTTNLDYNQTWIWDMTGIAKDGGPDALELYRKVLLASAAPPIAFPPVEIKGHLFADGGVRANLVALGLEGASQPEPPFHGPGNIYVIHNGRLTKPPQAVRADFTTLAATSVSDIMGSTMVAMLLRAYVATRLQGYYFNLVQIPDDADVGQNTLAFDPKQMQAGFDAGRALAQQPSPWRHVPGHAGDVPDWALEVLGKSITPTPASR